MGDVSQAFVHAPIDTEICTRVPESLEGITVNIDGMERVLHAGDWMQLMMALYGYRKAPRLWQDYFVERVEECKTVNMKRLKTEPSMFMESTGKEILLVVHVDDILILGDMKLVNALFEELKTKVLLKLVGIVQKVNDEVIYIGRSLRMTENGYVWSGGDKLVDTLLEETGLQHAKCMSSPAARITAKRKMIPRS